MNAEKNNCLSSMKGYSPDFQSYFSDCLDEIFNRQVYSKSFYADSLIIQRVKFESDDYQNRGGK